MVLVELVPVGVVVPTLVLDIAAEEEIDVTLNEREVLGEAKLQNCCDRDSLVESWSEQSEEMQPVKLAGKMVVPQ